MLFYNRTTKPMENKQVGGKKHTQRFLSLVAVLPCLSFPAPRSPNRKSEKKVKKNFRSASSALEVPVPVSNPVSYSPSLWADYPLGYPIPSCHLTPCLLTTYGGSIAPSGGDGMRGGGQRLTSSLSLVC